MANCGGQGTPVSGAAAYLLQGSTKRGAVQLCRDSVGAYFSVVILYQPLPAGEWANAWLDTWNSAGALTRWTCDNSGAGHVGGGGSYCRTPAIQGAYHYQARASIYYRDHDGAWYPYVQASGKKI